MNTIRIHCTLGGSITLRGIAAALFNTRTVDELIVSQTEQSLKVARAICERDCEGVESAHGVTRYKLPCGRVAAFYGERARIEGSARK